jgi:uncharacterized protein (DUF1810 family)
VRDLIATQVNTIEVLKKAGQSSDLRYAQRTNACLSIPSSEAAKRGDACAISALPLKAEIRATIVWSLYHYVLEPMTEPDLIRFLDAQASIYSRVVEELTDGRKKTHWMWFIFPQIAGLGRTATAQHYAIRDLDQARRYLADSTLGPRLRECVRLMMNHKAKLALEILGSPDDLKFRSCLTLFRQAALEDPDRALFTEALNQFYRGEADARTLELLAL